LGLSEAGTYSKEHRVRLRPCDMEELTIVIPKVKGAVMEGEPVLYLRRSGCSPKQVCVRLSTLVLQQLSNAHKIALSDSLSACTFAGADLHVQLLTCASRPYSNMSCEAQYHGGS
jgi:hypothetical protein